MVSVLTVSLQENKISMNDRKVELHLLSKRRGFVRCDTSSLLLLLVLFKDIFARIMGPSNLVKVILHTSNLVIYSPIKF